jgi:hypothetical protein
MRGLKSKAANFMAVWDQRISFALRLDSKPMQFVSWGLSFSTFCGVFHIDIKYPALAIGAAVILIVIQAWLLSRTNLQKKFDGVTARQNQEWLDHVKDTKNIKERLDDLHSRIH